MCRINEPPEWDLWTTSKNPAIFRCNTANSSKNRDFSMLQDFSLQQNLYQIFFKENVRYPVWTCRDAISLILGTRFSLILGTRWYFSLILGTQFSILGSRMGPLKYLKKPAYWVPSTNVLTSWSHGWDAICSNLILKKRSSSYLLRKSLLVAILHRRCLGTCETQTYLLTYGLWV